MKGTVKIGAAEAYSQQMKDQGYPVSPAAYKFDVKKAPMLQRVG